MANGDDLGIFDEINNTTNNNEKKKKTKPTKAQVLEGTGKATTSVKAAQERVIAAQQEKSRQLAATMLQSAAVDKNGEIIDKLYSQGFLNSDTAFQTYKKDNPTAKRKEMLSFAQKRIALKKKYGKYGNDYSFSASEKEEAQKYGFQDPGKYTSPLTTGMISGLQFFGDALAKASAVRGEVAEQVGSAGGEFNPYTGIARQRIRAREEAREEERLGIAKTQREEDVAFREKKFEQSQEELALRTERQEAELKRLGEMSKAQIGLMNAQIADMNKKLTEGEWSKIDIGSMFNKLITEDPDMPVDKMILRVSEFVEGVKSPKIRQQLKYDMNKATVDTFIKRAKTAVQAQEILDSDEFEQLNNKDRKEIKKKLDKLLKKKKSLVSKFIPEEEKEISAAEAEAPVTTRRPKPQPFIPEEEVII